MTRKHELDMLTQLQAALADRLVAVLSYGADVDEGDDPQSDFLLIVLTDLDLGTMRLLSGPMRSWLKTNAPWPRVFSTEVLRASTDVFPIEYLELLERRRVLFGSDPIKDVEIDRSHLRMQCERELREKLMRLREGYIESHAQRDTSSALRHLLAVSYPSFIRIFRACLFLLRAPVAHRDRDVVITLCTWLDRPPEPLLAPARIARHERGDDPEAVFADYYQSLLALEARIDRLLNHP